MASGILGKATVPANTVTTVYTVPNATGTISVVNMSIVNTGTTNTNVTIQIGSTIIENNALLSVNEGFARSCGVLGPSETINITSSSGPVDVVINGIEKVGYVGGTLSSGSITSGQTQTYTAPSNTQYEYVMLDYNVVNISSNNSTYSVKIDGTYVEYNTNLPPNIGVFRALGPISPSSVVEITCNTGGPLSCKISGRLY